MQEAVSANSAAVGSGPRDSHKIVYMNTGRLLAIVLFVFVVIVAAIVQRQIAPVDSESLAQTCRAVHSPSRDQACIPSPWKPRLSMAVDGRILVRNDARPGRHQQSSLDRTI